MEEKSGVRQLDGRRPQPRNAPGNSCRRQLFCRRVFGQTWQQTKRCYKQVQERSHQCVSFHRNELILYLLLFVVV